MLSAILFVILSGVAVADRGAGHEGGLSSVLPAVETLSLQTLEAEAAPEEQGGGEGDVHALDGDRWLVARERALWRVDGGEYSQLWPGRYEAIDSRREVLVDARPHVLVSAIDAEAGQVVLFLLDGPGGAVVDRRQLDYAGTIPDAQCLYTDPGSGNISLFTIDARGTLEQRYIYHRAAQALVDITVRRDVGVPEVEGCAVHDAGGHLYLAEGAVGVWRLGATEESDPTRSAQLLVSPWGPLGGDVEDIAIDSAGALWVLVADERRVYRQTTNETLREYALPATVEAIAVAVSADGAAVALFDEAAGRALRAVGYRGASEAAPRSAPHPSIPASRETAPVRRYGDAADDPAIYVAPDPSQSLILGTDKREGLAVYNLQGEQLQMLPVGRVNNVDLLTGVLIDGERRTIAAASNRTNDSISLFTVDDSGLVRHRGDVPTTLEDVYGLCLYASSTGAYVFINATDGRYQQYRLAWSDAVLSAERVREFQLPSQPEGCVADTQEQRIYMGEEGAGVWEGGAEPDGDAPRLVIPTGPALVADVEGMDIYREASGANARGRRLLVVSSQGSDSYAVFDLDDDYRLLASFSVGANLAAGVDGVSETDGLAVTSAPLPDFPEGVLIVQDGRNRMPDAPQNFKIVDWREVSRLLPQPP